jgi:hypothetical protein
VAVIERVMMRCRTCTRWWSVGPGDEPRCACGGDLAPVDMKAHIASLPEGAKTHSHMTAERRPRGECEACDREYLAESQAKAKDQIPGGGSPSSTG